MRACLRERATLGGDRLSACAIDWCYCPCVHVAQGAIIDTYTRARNPRQHAYVQQHLRPIRAREQTIHPPTHTRPQHTHGKHESLRAMALAKATYTVDIPADGVHRCVNTTRKLCAVIFLFAWTRDLPARAFMLDSSPAGL